MKSKAVFFIAARYLLGRGKEGGRYLLGSAFGIALSLVPIIVTLVVADGMISGITERFLEVGSYHYQIYARAYGVDATAPLDLIKQIPGVRGVWPEAQGLGLLVGSSASSGVSIRAIDPAFLEDEGVKRYLSAKEGELALTDSRSALLGEALAKKIGAKIGDTARLMIVRTTEDGRRIPKLALFKVKGIVSSGYQELDALWCFIPYDAGLSFLPPDSVRPFLGVKVDDPHDDDEKVRHEISALLSNDFAIYSWYEIQRSQYKSYETTRQLLILIMFLAVLVAAVNVASATSMLVVERRRDIAVLKSFGIGPRATTGIFLFAAGLTGALGALIGTAGGLVAAIYVNELIRFIEGLISGITGLLSLFGASSLSLPTKLLDPAYYLESIPIIINWTTISQIGVGAILCSIVAAWAPARRAGKLAPLEILRRY